MLNFFLLLFSVGTTYSNTWAAVAQRVPVTPSMSGQFIHGDNSVTIFGICWNHAVLGIQLKDLHMSYGPISTVLF